MGILKHSQSLPKQGCYHPVHFPENRDCKNKSENFFWKSDNNYIYNKEKNHLGEPVFKFAPIYIEQGMNEEPVRQVVYGNHFSGIQTLEFNTISASNINIIGKKPHFFYYSMKIELQFE